MAVSLTGLNKHSRHEMKKIIPLLNKVNALASEMENLSDAEMRNYTQKLKDAYSEHGSLDKILPEAFALVREAAKRSTGLYPYDVQILGGIELYKGHIAEMKTGEGKTLVAALPSYLMALTGNGVHVVTVNDYLANRDANDIGRIHRFLGLTVGCVLHDMKNSERKNAYACDVTYVTNTELGFDYLRDNMAMNINDRVLRGLHYAIIDEVDSILIDEARTPLIISGAKGSSTDFYKHCDIIAKMLRKGKYIGELTKMDALSGVHREENGDYVVDEKERRVFLTDQGVLRVERMLGLENYSDEKHAMLRHHLQMALRANGLMQKDKDYVIKDGEVIIVDTFTGRMMDGRRYSDGLHQALEAKEGVEIKDETQTLATITYQNFFNKYEKKAGMTGTAVTSSDELHTIYNLDVIMVPTNKPVVRVDEEDAVYLTKTAKRNAIAQAVLDCYKRRQPVLVGTTTIQESEMLSRYLRNEHVPHEVLNAKQHAREAEIISHAGEAGRVTIATNMAGRGTDIKLSDEARELGGLYVIGTERHEARRIDNQLRGRSGRQGDPGRSKFYLSLDDDVMRLFGSDKIINMLRSLGASDDEPIEHKSVTKMVNDAQKKIEDNNFGLRKSLLDYDEVNNEHRELIYAQRNCILNGANPDEIMVEMVKYVAEYLVQKYYDGKPADYDLKGFAAAWHDVFPEFVDLSADKKVMLSQAVDTATKMFDKYTKKYHSLVELRDSERYVILRCIDWYWLQHLDYLDHLRDSTSFVGYGQRNPVLFYKTKAYDGFEDLLHKIVIGSVRLFFTTEPKSTPTVYTDHLLTDEMKVS